MQNFTQQDKNSFCPNCGQPLLKSESTCSNCGYIFEVPKKPSSWLSGDGIKININNEAKSFGHRNAPKNKWISLILLIFLGFFGGHKFYEGKIGMGVVYLLTAGLFFVGLIVDLVKLISSPVEYYV